jgi:hypothetical protein
MYNLYTVGLAANYWNCISMNLNVSPNQLHIYFFVILLITLLERE